MVGRYGVGRPIGPEPFEQLKRQRSRLVQGLLWLLLFVMGAAFALNVVLLGRDIFTVNGLLPNLTFIAMLCVGLRLNRSGHFRVAVWMIVLVTLLAGVWGLLQSGVQAGELSLLILFLPLILAGLLLGRAALLACAGVTLAGVIVTPFLHGAAPLGASDPSGSAWIIVIQFVIVYVAVALLLDRFGLMFYSAMHTATSKITNRKIERVHGCSHVTGAASYQSAAFE